MITFFSSMLCRYTDNVVVKVVTVLHCVKCISIKKFRRRCILLRFYLGAVYQTLPTSLNDRKALAAQTDSFGLMKKKSVTSNVKQLEASKTNITEKVPTSLPCTANTQKTSSGMDYFTN